MESITSSIKKRNPTTKIHLWMPDIFSFKGGIQVYSAFFLRAIQSINRDAQYRVCLKHDTNCAASAYLSQTKFNFAGRVPLSLRTPFFAVQLLSYGLIYRPHLIISTHINFTLVAYWLNKLTGIPYWAIAHGVEAWNITNSQQQQALKAADRILAVSNYTRDRLLAEQNLNPDRVSILPNTFEADRFQIAPKPQYLLDRYRLTATQPVILTVARLDNSERPKGYEGVLRSLPSIRAAIPNIRYIIVGKGRDRPRLERLIEDLNLQDSVTLAGFVPDAELNDHYNLCDVFAMPSQGEGFGIVYLEALACGKPTLGGDGDGTVDALGHGELGVLVDPDDLKAIAQNLTAILQGTHKHPLIYQPEILRQQASQRFGFQQFQARLADLLQTHSESL